jgi:hypothetical protein
MKIEYRGTKVPRTILFPVPYVQLGTKEYEATWLSTGDVQEIPDKYGHQLLSRCPESFRLVDPIKQVSQEVPAPADPEAETASEDEVPVIGPRRPGRPRKQ